MRALSEQMSVADTVTSSVEHNLQTEAMAMSETFTAQSLNYEVDWVLAPQIPSGHKREMRLDITSFLE